MSDQPVVILIHGIRTAAWWQNRVASMIESETSATVIPIKYGYFDLLRFWCPFGICRSGPVEKLRQQIEGIAKNYPDRPLIVFAHSYGTYALTRVILQNPYFRFDRIILCGSVVPSTFDWRAVEDQIRGTEKRNAIINECGTRDIWPVMAQSITWGYGATGTYGFGTFNVRDRFHHIAHSDFFADEFARKYWIPLVKGDKVSFSDEDVKGGGTPGWFNLLRLPLKWIVPAAAVAAAVVLALPIINGAPSCAEGERMVGGECHTTAHYATVNELQGKIRALSIQVQNTLDEKSDVLFPKMTSYISAPSPEKWQEVQSTALKLLGFIEAGLDEIVDSKATFASNSKGTFYVTSDATIPVDPVVVTTFADIRGHFTGRRTIVDEMRASDMPTAEQMTKWQTELEELHRQLQESLRKLDELLVVTV